MPNAEEIEFQIGDREADDRLLHSLLVQIHSPSLADERQRRVDRVMRSIRSSPSRSNSSPWRSQIVRRVIRGVMAIAAVVLILIGISKLPMMSRPASASITEVLGALNGPGDRTYRLHVEPSDALTSPHHGLEGATLDLRQGGEYLLTRYTPGGEALLDGFDGQQSWRIRRGQVVEIKQGLGAGGIPMPNSMADLSIVDLAQTLAQLQAGYSIDRFDQASLQTGGVIYSHLLAHRRTQAVKGPTTIEIWANSATGIPQRIVFDGAKFQGSLQPRRLTFDLINQSSLSSTWFSPGGHLTAGSASVPTIGPSLQKSN